MAEPTCTGLTARWCPFHGDCLCPPDPEDLDSPDCPLHSRDSTHAAGPDPDNDVEAERDRLAARVAELEQRIATIADEAVGMQPVQSADDSLSAIERYIFELRRARADLGAALDERPTCGICGGPRCDCEDA